MSIINHHTDTFRCDGFLSPGVTMLCPIGSSFPYPVNTKNNIPTGCEASFAIVLKFRADETIAPRPFIKNIQHNYYIGESVTEPLQKFDTPIPQSTKPGAVLQICVNLRHSIEFIFEFFIENRPHLSTGACCCQSQIWYIRPAVIPATAPVFAHFVVSHFPSLARGIPVT